MRNLKKTAHTPARSRRPSRRPGERFHAGVARAIGLEIVQGRYQPGQTLPNEQEWGRHFRASRTVIREAIKTLNGKGLLASRPKVGSVVEPRERWNMMDRDVLAWHLAATGPIAFQKATQEVRKAFEPGIAALAATKRSPEQLARLEAALEAMRAAKNGEEFVRADVAFHLALLSAANNPLMLSFGRMIEHALPYLFDYTRRRNPAPEMVVPLHAKVVRAVKRGNPKAARRAIDLLLVDTDNAIEQADPADKPR
jgi:DNA-binding FadR family transcriptional regulator